MTGSMGSRSITKTFIVRQDTEPGRKLDGMLWINPTGGASGNNSERYYWDADAQSWKLDTSVGPDTPLHEAAGAFWRDTANSVQKVYDGSWQSLSQALSVESPQDVSGSRSFGTQYTNSAGDPLIVNVVAQFSVSDGQRPHISVNVDSTSQSNYADVQGGANDFVFNSIRAMVPDGSTYTVDASGGDSVSLYAWTEQQVILS